MNSRLTSRSWDRIRRLATSRSIVSRSVRHGLTMFVVALLVEYVVLPQLAGARNSLHLLDHVHPLYAAAGLLLEAGALLAYAQLTRSVLPPGSPSLFTLLRIDLSGLAVSHILPGGTAGGAPVSLRLLTGSGVSTADATFALATQSIGSALVLNLLLWIGLVVSIPVWGLNPLYGVAALLGALLLSLLAVVVLLLTKREERTAEVLRSAAARLPFLEPDLVTGIIRRLATRVRELSGNRPLLGRATGWAAANWLLDAASLWVFLAAFGHLSTPYGLLVAYGLANVMAVLPITPGGLGVVEGVLVPTLIGFGSPRGIAILGVITYRLVNFWLPIPVGGLAYLSLRVEPDVPPRRRAEELERLAEAYRRQAEQRRQWAGLHGLRVHRQQDATRAVRQSAHIGEAARTRYQEGWPVDVPLHPGGDGAEPSDAPPHPTGSHPTR
jgi:hypothetical protein